MRSARVRGFEFHLFRHSGESLPTVGKGCGNTPRPTAYDDVVQVVERVLDTHEVVDSTSTVVTRPISVSEPDAREPAHPRSNRVHPLDSSTPSPASLGPNRPRALARQDGKGGVGANPTSVSRKSG